MNLTHSSAVCPSHHFPAFPLLEWCSPRCWKKFSNASACLVHLVHQLQGAQLYLGNAGTAMRPLTAAVAAAGRGKFVLDGVARMRERPIQDLVDGLVQLGVDAQCTLGTGCPPVEVNAQGLPSGRVSCW